MLTRLGKAFIRVILTIDSCPSQHTKTFIVSYFVLEKRGNKETEKERKKGKVEKERW